MLCPQLCPMFFTDYSVEESYQPRDYLAATMQFMPGHFACEVVWSTLIHVHSRLKMGPNMGVSRGTCSLHVACPSCVACQESSCWLDWHSREGCVG